MADSLHSSSRNILQRSAVSCFARSESATLHAIGSAWLENTGRAKAENRCSTNSETNCALTVLSEAFSAALGLLFYCSHERHSTAPRTSRSAHRRFAETQG